MASSSSSDVVTLCLACGEVARKKGRRVLGGRGSPSEGVTFLWRDLTAEELQGSRRQLNWDDLITQFQGQSYMCRREFSSTRLTTLVSCLID